MARVLFAALALFCLSCQTRSVTRITPETQMDLSGRWNDSDSRIVADKMINELLTSPRFKTYAEELGRKPAIVVGLIRNKTSEHIDANNYIKKLEVAIYNSQIAELVESEEFRDKLRLRALDEQATIPGKTVRGSSHIRR